MKRITPSMEKITKERRIILSAIMQRNKNYTLLKLIPVHG